MPSCADTKPILPTVYYKAYGEPLYHKVTQSVIQHEGKIFEQSKWALQSHKKRGSGLAFTSDGKMTIVQNVSEASALSECKPYSPVHPRSISLSSCIDDTRKDYCLAFTANFQATPNFQSLRKEGQSVQLAVIPLYHDHIIWIYALKLVREGDGLFLTLNSVLNKERSKYEFSSMHQIDAPKMIEAELDMDHPEKGAENNKLEFYRKPAKRDVFYVPNAFTESELRQLHDHSGKLNIQIRLVLPRSFFDFHASHICCSCYERPRAAASVRWTVNAILKGKTPEGSDLKIRGASTCACHPAGVPGSLYYVHESTFLNAGFPQLANSVKGYSQVERSKGIPIKVADPTDSKGGKLVLCDHVLRLAIPLAYGLDAPLPVRGSFNSKFVMALYAVFEIPFFVRNIQTHWERAICAKALAMDVRDPSSSMVELLHLLHITCHPDGSLPVARKVAIGVLADMAHLNARSSVQQWVVDEVLPHLEESCCGSEYVGGILSEFYQMVNTVSAVEKKMVPLVAAVWGS